MGDARRGRLVASLSALAILGASRPAFIAADISKPSERNAPQSMDAITAAERKRMRKAAKRREKP